MTQRQITINACPLLECGPTSFSVSIGLRGDAPSKRVDINTVDDCKAALAAFASEFGPSGKPWHLSVHFERRCSAMMLAQSVFRRGTPGGGCDRGRLSETACGD
jgi:hypothetical protein